MAVGQQQVTIYPFEPLASVYGNELLYGVLQPGVYAPTVNGAGQPIVVIGNGANGTDPSKVQFTIKSGSTFIFQRSSPDPVNPSLPFTQFIGKVVLTSDDSTISVNKVDLWHNTGSYISAQTLYVVATWQYIPGNSTNINATFSLLNDQSMIALKQNDGGFSHILVIATILNQPYFINQYNLSPGNVNSFPLSNYHIVHDYQKGRNVFNRLNANNDSFIVDFDPNGRGVYVESGNIIVADGFLPWTPTFDQIISVGGTFPGRLATSGPGYAISTPPAGLQFYTSNVVTNAQIDVVATGTQSSYYQIDMLRFKSDENTHITNMYWESFLKPAGSLDFTNYTMTTAQLLAYLSQYQFPVMGDGLTLLVSVRPRSNVTLPDNSLNVLWPESCIYPKHSIIPIIGTVKNHSRFKIPVWNSSDLGY